MLLIGLLARLHLRRLNGIAYFINLGPGEPLHLELIYDLAYLAPVDKFPRNYFLSDLTLRRNQPPEQEEQPDDYDDSDYEGGGFQRLLVVA